MLKLSFCIALLIFAVQAFSQDTLVVQIAHGSKPYRQYKDETKTIGGKKGGHVVLQIDSFVYGFFFNGTRIHIFPHKHRKNSVFQKQTLPEWENITKDKRLTCFFVPVTAEEKKFLLGFYSGNLRKPGYDYAFFGQRCASSVYNNLKAINKIKGGSYFFYAFYPGQLRKKLIKQSRIFNYRITVIPGSIKRKWEGD